MKITVLGCGSSAGVPVMGPEWGACDPSNPKNRRTRVSILVEHDDTRVLVDTSPDLREQAIAAGLRSVDAVIYTHGHADHSHGIDDLRGFNFYLNGPLDVYADADTLAVLTGRFGYAFENRQAAGPWYRPSLIANQIDGELSIGAVDVRPFTQTHGYGTTLGLRFGDFAYSTDVNALSESAFEALAGIDTWLVDCVRYAPSPGHSHLAQTLDWIEQVRPRRAILTHMGIDFDYDRLRDELPDGVEPAYDGMTFTVKE